MELKFEVNLYMSTYCGLVDSTIFLWAQYKSIFANIFISYFPVSVFPLNSNLLTNDNVFEKFAMPIFFNYFIPKVKHFLKRFT